MYVCAATTTTIIRKIKQKNTVVVNYAISNICDVIYMRQ